VTYFFDQPALDAVDGDVYIKVRRDHILEDSFTEVMGQSPNDLKKRLWISFESESEFSHDGVSRSVASVHNPRAKGPH
jgi:E3 ubiquitin-protein ligase NEDD4